jgi:hypothetical protein
MDHFEIVSQGLKFIVSSARSHERGVGSTVLLLAVVLLTSCAIDSKTSQPLLGPANDGPGSGYQYNPP